MHQNRFFRQKQQITSVSSGCRQLHWKSLLAVVVLSGGFLPLGAIAQTLSPAPGTIIENQATGSFVDPTDSSTQLIESNVVSVTVTEVAGIMVTTQTLNGTANPGDLVNFEFTITNVGNDPTQFVLPSTYSALLLNGSAGGGSQEGALTVIAYDPDGTGSTSPTTLNIPVSAQSATGSLAGFPNAGAIPAGGSVTVRIPIRLASTLTNADVVSATLGNTAATAGQNEPYVAGSQDVYTQDNAGTSNGDTTGNPANGEREASASRSVTIAVAAKDYGDAPDTGIGGYETLSARNGPSHVISPDLYLGSTAPDADTDGFGDGIDTAQNATDDDTQGAADEGSLTFNSVTASTTTYSVTVPVFNNTGSNTAVLVGWIDFDRNGVFDSDEAAIASNISSSGTSQNIVLTWNNIGSNIDINVGTSYARFRLSTDTNVAAGGTALSANTPNGSAIDGEVEDYQLAIATAPFPPGALPNSTPPPPTSLSCHDTVFGNFVPDRSPFSTSPNKYSVDTVWTATAFDGTTATLRTVAINDNSGNFVSTGSDPDVFFLDFVDPNTGFSTPKLTEREGEPGDSWVLELQYNRPIGSARILIGDVDSQFSSATTQFKDIVSVESFLNNTSISSTHTYRGSILVESTSGNRHTFEDNPAQTDNAVSGNVDKLGPNPADSSASNRIVVDYENTFVDTAQITYAVGKPLTGAATQSVFMTSGMAAGCRISGTAFGDASANDLLDNGEVGLNNVTVTLYKDDGDNLFETNGDDLLIETYSTQNGGDYLFTNLAEGENYWVDIDTADPDLNGYRYGGGDVEITQTDPRSVVLGTQDVGGVTFPFDLFVNVRVALIKRITAINRGLGNAQLFDTAFVDVGTSNDDDNETNWPGGTASANGGGTVESYLAGMDNVTARPGDQVEYTLSFLSHGDGAAKDTLICDRIPPNTTFVHDAFNSSTPAAPGNSDRGIFVSFNSANVALTNLNDGDEIPNTGGNDNGVGGYYFPANLEPSTVFSGIDCGGTNGNGAIVVDLSDIPNATGEGTPVNSYGFIRFKVVVQ
jgi:uncharacterized repeat protein (TIGR01451 family)